VRRAETAERSLRSSKAMGGRRRLSALSTLSAVSVLSCARIEPPPGGPPDTAPPRLVSTRPDSFARIPGFKGDAEFKFDEVVSEGSSPNQGTGTGDLEKLVILSPSTRVPQVSWHRDRITVRPSEGWRPDRVYRVELLPGVTDLRNNKSTRGTVLTFTTGAPLPSTTIEGTVVDWSTGRPAPGALVEAILMPDSLPYRGLADSTGHLSLGPLPEGTYLVRGILDENKNLQADPREAFDSVRLAPGKTSAGELWAFVHDTTPPRIREITVGDSTSAVVSFSQDLDPRQRLAPAAARVRSLPDSAPIPVVSLLPKALDDSLHRPPLAARDTTDTTRKARPGIVEVPPEGQPLPRGRRRAPAELQPLTSRPPLSDQLVLRVPRPWKPDGKYEVEIRGVRNVTGVAGDTKGVLTVPKTPADTSRRGADSLKLGPDTLKRRLRPQKKP
jgi:Big-like domain-containing protein